MRRLSVAAAKTRFSSVLAQVEAGEDVVITRQGVAIARIVAEPARPADGFDLQELFQFGASYLDTSLPVPLLIREPGTRRAALTMFEKFRDLRLEMVPIEAADFEVAARLCDASQSPLRAGDALHLAVCRRSRGSLATIDVALAAAGREAGLTVELIQV